MHFKSLTGGFEFGRRNVYPPTNMLDKKERSHFKNRNPARAPKFGFPNVDPPTHMLTEIFSCQLPKSGT